MNDEHNSPIIQATPSVDKTNALDTIVQPTTNTSPASVNFIAINGQPLNVEPPHGTKRKLTPLIPQPHHPTKKATLEHYHAYHERTSPPPVLTLDGFPSFAVLRIRGGGRDLFESTDEEEEEDYNMDTDQPPEDLSVINEEHDWIEIHRKYVDVRQSASIKRAQREMGSITRYFQPRKRKKTTDTVPPDLSQPKAPS